MISLMSPYPNENPFSKWWNSRNFLQRRMIRLFLTTLVLAVCFPLYYLGFFGTVDGPLNPGRIGESLSGIGVTRAHSMVFFLSCLILAVTWNWIYNIVSLLIGARLTCNKLDEDGKPCGARVERRKVEQKKTGQKVTQFVCANGHKRPDAHFHPVQKGAVSHTIWLMAVAFCVIVFFLS